MYMNRNVFIVKTQVHPKWICAFSVVQAEVSVDITPFGNSSEREKRQ